MSVFVFGSAAVLIIAGIGALFVKNHKLRQVGILITVLGILVMVAGLGKVSQDHAKQRAEQQAIKRAEIAAESEADDAQAAAETASAESESAANAAAARAQSESDAAASESAAQASTIAASESAAAVAASQAAQASQAAAESASQQAAQAQAASQYSDPRPAQTTGTRNYAYQPVPQTGASETVYVNASIPGRYHKDPNCRGLQRYGGGTAMPLASAQAQGYQAYCAYERYGNN